ncbi:MAG: AbrB/MazE/SpoVT family DNA-binding domain-containing protein [Armatimonadota bacterium]|nr:AbrB/MazE/SpoVT family DNA-binding domain-containing protein [Armatimonadota bacterium]MCX7777315.1 AbrB/MazE/SpoVT family DNA-binding domain-containing protein [Armatimonadota bacterium]MDW8024368.1 AbrB/MazE/SpoVT family DNA-binding domain-containing protein [Armatimonadota bacterium]
MGVGKRKTETSRQGSLQRLFRGVVTVGNRGQIVLPAELRRECDIKPKDKLLVFSHPAGVGILLMPTDRLEEVWLELQAHLRAAERRR